jgi:hypothetical protein
VCTVGGCVVSRKAVLQHVVALSTIEAECMVIAEACKKLIWLKGLYIEFCGVDSCINLFSESQSAILLKIRCSMKRQSTLRSSTVMFDMRSKSVS